MSFADKGKTLIDGGWQALFDQIKEFLAVSVVKKAIVKIVAGTLGPAKEKVEQVFAGVLPREGEKGRG